MILTGYHGTTEESAQSILKNKEYSISSGKTEWLGEGVYFYFEYHEAVKWTVLKKYSSPAVLHNIIHVNDNEYIDLDEKEGKDLFQSVIDRFCESGVPIDNTKEQQNQCAVANEIWKRCKECKLMMGTFHSEKRKMRTLTDPRPTRREFCLRNSDPIKSIVRVEVIQDD